MTKMRVPTTKWLPFKRALIAGIFLASSLGVASVASATEADCSGFDDICLWGNNDYNWLIFKKWEDSGNYTLVGGINNQMDSWKNRSEDYDGSGYDKADFTGDCQEFAKSKKDNNVAFWNSDEVSAVKTGTDC